MQVEFKQGSGTSVPMYVLGAIFLVPLTIGVLMVTSSATRNEHANQASRDVASMYAQGLDFSNRANQNIALNVAEGLGIDIRNGKGVLILSKIRVVHDADCGANGQGNCANKGYAVVTQRFVIGNPALRNSSFGAPGTIDAATGNVRNWASDVSARADDYPANLKAGEFTYAAECYLAGDSRTGVYARAMF
jgi:hypothetical protein